MSALRNLFQTKGIRRRLTLQTVGLLVLLCVGFATFTTTCYFYMIRGEFDQVLEHMWSAKAGQFSVDASGSPKFTPPGKVQARDGFFRPTFYELWSADGKLVFQSESMHTLPALNVFGAPDLELLRTGHGSIETAEVENAGIFRVRSSPLKIGEREYLFRAARESSEVRARTVGLIQTFANLLLFLVVVAFFAASWLIKRTFAPVEAVRLHAEQISARKLHERLPVANPDDEIGQLSITLNKLLDRLESSFEEMKNFTSDASHELRTPLAAIRALGESTLCRNGPVEETREALRDILEETQRLTGLTDRLLTMARLDARAGESRPKETFDLSAQTRGIVEHLEVLASDKNQAIELDLPAELRARGDATLVHQALANLIDNAIKYTPENGRIRIAGERADGAVRVSVTDTGPGISKEHQGLVFRRFFRVDSDRGRATGGYGVGLAIAKKAVELSEGTMELESEIGRGSRFTVSLPAAASV